ncbi:MAG: hypothetical protein ACYCS1_02995 [Gammaproteobacteria bacterium]
MTDILENTASTRQVSPYILLNTAYFVLGRALLNGLGVTPWLADLGIVLLALGIATAVLTGLYTFQPLKWIAIISSSRTLWPLSTTGAQHWIMQPCYRI